MNEACRHRDGRYEIRNLSEVRELGDLGSSMHGNAWRVPYFPHNMRIEDIGIGSSGRLLEVIFTRRQWAANVWIPERLRCCEWCSELVEVGHYVHLTWFQWERTDVTQ